MNDYTEYNDIWTAYGKCKPITESLDDDKAHSTAGLSPFSNTHEQEGWPAADTIEMWGDIVIKSAGDFLDTELLHPKITNFDDIHPDLREDLPGMVIDALQKDGKLGKYLDYDDYTDERQELKDAITSYLYDHFDELVDVAEDNAVAKGDRPPLDSGVEPEVNPYGQMDPADEMYPLIKRSPEEFGESVEEDKVECSKCKGKGCEHCNGKGYHTKKEVEEGCGCGLPVLQQKEREPVIGRIVNLLKGVRQDSDMLPDEGGKVIKITKLS